MDWDNENLDNNEGQEGVVDPENEIKDDDFDLDDDVVSNDDDSDDDYDEGEEQGENDPDVADQEQSKDDNAKFAKMRRKAEHDAQSKLERERQDLERERQEFQRIKQQNEYEKNVNAAMTDEKVWQKADELGISEDDARKFLKLELENQALKEQQQRQAHEYTLSTKLEQFNDLPNFSVYKEDIRQAALSNPDLDIEVAYDYFNGRAMRQTHKNEIEGVKKRTQQRTVADIQDRAKRSGSIASSPGKKDDVDYRKVLTVNDIEMARAFGNDPTSVAKYVKKSKSKKG